METRFRFGRPLGRLGPRAWSLRRKLLISFLFVSLVPLLVFGYFATRGQEDDLREDASERMKILAETQQTYINSVLELDVSESSHIASQALLRERLTDALNEPSALNVASAVSSLQAELEKSHRLDGATLVDAKGSRVLASGNRVRLPASHLVDGEVPFGRVVGTVDSDVTMLSSFEIADGGVLILEHDISYLQAIAADRRGLGETGEITIAQRTPEGAQLIVPTRFNDASALDVTVSWDRAATPIVEAFGQSPIETFESAVDYRGQETIGATGHIEATDWALVTKIDDDEALGVARHFQQSVLVMSMVIALCAVLVGIVFSRRLIARLGSLTGAVVAVSEGDLAGRVKVSTSDELGLLGSAFNSMADELAEARTRDRDREEELRTVNRRLEKSEERVRAVFDAAADGIVHLDNHGTVIDMNDAAKELFEANKHGLVGKLLGARLHQPSDPTSRDVALCESVSLNSLGTSAVITRDDGSEVPVSLKVAPIHAGDGIGYAMLIRDMSERVELERQVAQLATHDALTGLPNRRQIVDQITEDLYARNDGEEVAVLFCDLDRFKVVNDSLGHAAGDRLLSQVAQRLCEVVGDSRRVARFGGDEFLIVVNRVGSLDGVSALADRVNASIAGAIGLGDEEVFVTGSIGVAYSDGDRFDTDALIANADMAMYEAKQSGRERVLVWDVALRHAFTERLALGNALKRASESRQIELHYQPIVYLSDGRLWGVEALARWNRPGVGPVLPDEFIKVAEETGLIVQIGHQLFEQACRQMVVWQASTDETPERMTFNLSPRELLEPDLVENLAEIARRTGVEPSRIVIELTESMLVQDTEEAIEKLSALKEIGFGLALDDFGTGYSSLTYLRRLPLDLVKIDRSFIAQMTVDHANPGDSIVSMVITLANRMGLTVVAEGIESSIQFDLLHELDCDLGQGWFFGAAESVQELEDRLPKSRQPQLPTG